MKLATGLLNYFTFLFELEYLRQYIWNEDIFH
jgi:hypothetical protein